MVIKVENRRTILAAGGSVEIPPPLDPGKVLTKVREIQTNPTMSAQNAWNTIRASPQSFVMEAIDMSLVAPHAEKERGAVLISRYIAHGWDVMNFARSSSLDSIYTPTPLRTTQLDSFMNQVGAATEYVPTLLEPNQTTNTQDSSFYTQSLGFKELITEEFVAYLNSRSELLGNVIDALTLNLEMPDIIYAKIGLVGGILPFVHPSESDNRQTMPASLMYA